MSVKCFAGHVQIMFELLNEKKGEYTSDMYSCTVMIAVFSGTSFFFLLEVQLFVKMFFYVLVPKWLKVHQIFERFEDLCF